VFSEPAAADRHDGGRLVAAYLASWRGGEDSATPARHPVIARLTATGATPPPAPVLGTATDARLVELVAPTIRRTAGSRDRSLCGAGGRPSGIGLLEKAVLGTDSVAARSRRFSP
jgi:hypothetical protein